jgi:hypothetical protein
VTRGVLFVVKEDSKNTNSGKGMKREIGFKSTKIRQFRADDPATRKTSKN